MSRCEEVPIPCDNCGREFPAVLWGSVNTERPDLVDSFIKGSLNIVQCRWCGQRFFVPWPVLYNDMDRQLEVYVYEAALMDDPLKHMDPALIDVQTAFGVEFISYDGFLFARWGILHLYRSDAETLERLQRTYPTWSPGKIHAAVFLHHANLIKQALADGRETLESFGAKLDAAIASMKTDGPP